MLWMRPGLSCLAVSVAALSVGVGCGTSHSGSGGGGGTDAGGGGGDSTVPDGTVSDATLPSDGPTFGGDSGMPSHDGGGCASGADCDGSVCLMGSGTCCAASSVCGSACCGGATVCLFDQCVTPGQACHSAYDCPPNQYCEPALGGADAGAEDAAPLEAGCTSPLPIEGRCLPSPPTCADAGGDASPDAGDCIESCQYIPDAGGPLNAALKWQWGPVASKLPNQTDVWSTPTVGRIYDTNCDGAINSLDSPVIVFISGNVDQTCCGCNGASPSTCENGVLRMINGSNGQEVWTVQNVPGSVGFVGSSPALGDVDNDGYADVVTMTGEGYIVVFDRFGNLTHKSDKPYTHITALTAGQGTGWGGGLAIADMDADGFPEIAFGDTVWTTSTGNVTLSFTGGKGTGGGQAEETSTLVDLDGNPDNHLELLAGSTAYTSTGAVLWDKPGLPNGFSGVGDFNKDGTPEAVLVGCPVGGATPCRGQVWILDGATGAVVAGPATLPFGCAANEPSCSATISNHGGPPTVADFDGDGYPEIGVAGATYYAVFKPVVTNGQLTGAINVLWKMADHDFSSSVTGSTVFDFEGDGVPEVVYADECWLWVFDGPSGAVKLALSHSSFTGTEASMLADIDGDGHAELLLPSNGVDMHSWNCLGYATDGGTASINGQTWTAGPVSNQSYRGLAAYGDPASSWVGTRTLWNEHTYHVTNICDDQDNACGPPNTYGSIPKGETQNWTLPWLNDFRQNVEDQGIFNAPDAVVAVAVDCTTPVVAHVSVRNIGQAALPAGVNAGVFVSPGATQVGSVTTTISLLPSQTQTLNVTLSAPATSMSTFYAQILVNAANPTFHECNANNDTSANAKPTCTGGNQ